MPTTPLGEPLPDGHVDPLRAYALDNDTRNPSAVGDAILWLAAEVRALRLGART